jgi:hypothetical protein
MTYSCPRCGHVFGDLDRDAVAGQMVEHASTEHGHTLTLEHALAHLADDQSGHGE